MSAFGARSRKAYVTLHNDLIEVCDRVIKVVDFSITYGWRGEELQNELVSLGHSKTSWPRSKHNAIDDGGPCSLAMDVPRWPIDWNDRERFTLFAGFVMGVGYEMGVDLRWGGDWDRDWDVHDNSFDDLVHFELVEVKFDVERNSWVYTG